MIATLRAVLVNGFNVKAITGITVTAGVAVATCPAHGYSSDYGKWLSIAGAPVAALNGVKQQTIVNANSFSYPAPGVADGTYTGSIDARRAPLGWTETHNDGAGTKAIFARSVPEANAMSLRVVDTGAAPASTAAARVLMVRGATGVDTYTAQAPTEVQVPGGLVATKWANTAAAKPWLAIGTGQDFWLFVGDNTTAVRYLPAICFFDGEAYRPGDASFTVLAGTSGSSATLVSNALFVAGVLTTVPTTPASGVVFSDEAGAGLPQSFAVGSPFRNLNGHGSAGGAPADPLDFVIAYDNYLRAAAAGVRGTVPGNGEPFIASTSITSFGMFGVLDTSTGGKALLVRIFNSSSNDGITAFKLSEAWH
jgi:hypothetical protein